MISKSKSSWRPVTNSVPQKLVLSIFFIFFINDLDGRTAHTLSMFAEVTKLGGEAGTPEGCVPFRGTSEGSRNGLTGTTCSEKYKAKCCPSVEIISRTRTVLGRSNGKQLCRKDPGDRGGQQVEPVMCPHDTDG